MDIDILVDPHDEQRACNWLANYGFTVEPRWKNGHHAVCRHPQIGYLDLHTTLFDELVQDVWFHQTRTEELIQEAFIINETPDGAYHTLGHTDHLLFLTLHMTEHFIVSGMSLRMMLDVGTYIAVNKRSIDFDRFWNTICKFRYDGLVHCVLWALVKYCGFMQEDFPGICDASPDLQRNEISRQRQGYPSDSDA